MVRDVLAIQASLIASEAAFSETRFQLGDHRHSLAEECLKTLFLFRDWGNAERRNYNLPMLRVKLSYVLMLTRHLFFSLFPFEQTIACGHNHV